jgi:hypothetical protein
MRASETSRKRARLWLEECGRLMGGGNVVIFPEVEESCADLLDEVRDAAIEDAAKLVEELRRTEGIGLDASYFARRIRERKQP